VARERKVKVILSLMRRIQIEFYTKAGCGLCEEMKAVLKRVQGHYPLEIREVDIEGDPALYDRYKEEVPVLFIEGRKAFKFRVQEAALRRKLDLFQLRRRLFGA